MTTTPSAVDFNSMTPAQKTEHCFRQLCLRLLDIDEKCGLEKGCPFDRAALPMIQSWWNNDNGELPTSVAEPLRRMLATTDDGRACPFGEVKSYAQQFLNRE